MLGAQGATTAAVVGIVRDDQGRVLAGVDIEIRHRATGFVTPARSRDDGRYSVSGLESGGPYLVTARRIGYREVTQDGLRLSVGQAAHADFHLVAQVVQLGPITTEAPRDAVSSRASYGVGTMISDSLIHRLPIRDRDIYGSVGLVPQMTTWYGLSAAGASPRTNAIMVDGASEQGLYGGNAAGAIWGGKAISIEAVKEYQVLLSPFDVRHGNFAGALINAVTRSGTNELHGSGFYFGRYAALSRNAPFMRDARFERDQIGFSLGGPLVKNRAHFFVVPEFQRMVFPTVGPYVGQPSTATPALQVSSDTLARFEEILSRLGIGGGSSRAVTATNPLANLFARVDVALPSISSRLVFRENFSWTDSGSFSRPSSPPTPNCRSTICFPLSSLERRQSVWKAGTVAQLLTSFSSGRFNELIAGHLGTVSTITPTVRQPLILVQIGQSQAGQTLQTGAYEAAHGDNTNNQSVELTDNLTIPRGRHAATFGASAQLFRVRRFDLRGGLGVWTFPSLDALALGQAQSYRVAKDFGGADVSVNGAQYAVYAGDRWDVHSRASITYGLRLDIPTLGSPPMYSEQVDGVFGRRTDVVPSGRMHWSPRLGFAAELEDGTRLTAGVGAFMGRPPLSWIVNAYSNYGMPRTLSCGTPRARGAAPAFSADANHPPLACANGIGFTPDSAGSVNLLDPNLAFPQSGRASMTVERPLRWNTTGRIEGQYTRAIHELFFVNRNLAEPVGTDAHGRVMYGTIAATGRATPSLAKLGFNADVIELTNQSKDYAYSVTGGLEKRFASQLTADLSFTYGHVFDVQSQRFTRSPAFDNWRLGRTIAGRQDEPSLGVSDYDQPFRVVASGTYSLVRRGWTSDVSVYYVGASGFPFTYLAGGDQQTGDLNADNTPLNDPIYIPRTASDPAEISFDSSQYAASAQRQALDAFIDGASCLRRQRGRIMERNSCRSPWVNTLNVALRESRTLSRGHTLALELQVFNALNLLNSNWGRVSMPSGLTAAAGQVNLLTHVGQTSDSPSRSVFVFNPGTRRFDAGNVDSYYQIQIGTRYSF